MCSAVQTYITLSRKSKASPLAGTRIGSGACSLYTVEVGVTGAGGTGGRGGSTIRPNTSNNRRHQL
ncbi:hypothetical protein GCM10012279_20570 [Micromonospora yangpuensis]|nr:hypothetical protein GCM10012279_20570 [Micromonospora yangpuensis]